MKILITTDAYGEMVNGVAVSVKNLSSALQEAGHDVRILTLSQTHCSYREGNVYYIRSVPLRIYPDVRATLALHDPLLKEIAAWNPGVIHSQSEFFTFLLARRLSHLLQAPIVHTYHTLYEYYTHYFCPSKRLGRRIAKAGTRIVLNRTAAVIAPTEKTADILKGYKVAVQIFVVPTGLDLEKFDPANERADKRADQRTDGRGGAEGSVSRAALSIPEDAPVLVTLGRLAREKNIDFLIRRMADPRLKKLGVHLVVVGDGPDGTRLKSLTDQLHLRGTVHFTGMAAPGEVARYYRLGDVFASASASETQGLTYLEAMASSLPLLCRKDPCLESVLIPGAPVFSLKIQTPSAIFAAGCFLRGMRCASWVGRRAPAPWIFQKKLSRAGPPASTRTSSYIRKRRQKNEQNSHVFQSRSGTRSRGTKRP